MSELKRFFKKLSCRARSSSPTRNAQPTNPYAYDPRKPKPASTGKLSSISPDTVRPAHILLPLYIYPTLHPTNDWDPIYAALAAHPSVTFSIIVNPGSGPGRSKYPDSNYITSISRLRRFPNAHLLGYVSTQYTKRDRELVEDDIAQYAEWANFTPEDPDSGIDIHVDGIFFDEAPSGWDDETSEYMRAISHFTQTRLPPTGNHVTFNPGVICDTRFFDMADEVVVSENGYAMFGMDILRFVDDSLRAKASVVVHGFNGTAREMEEMIIGLAAEGFGGVYITTEGGYTGWGTLWETLASSVAATTTATTTATTIPTTPPQL